MKYGVEGVELLVLRGAQSTLRHFHPKLFLELDVWRMRPFGLTTADVFPWLRQIGYSHFHKIDSQLIPLVADRLWAAAVFCSLEELHGLA
jgi:hypothetical protein